METWTNKHTLCDSDNSGDTDVGHIYIHALLYKTLKTNEGLEFTNMPTSIESDVQYG